jgi:nucleoside transporter
MTAGIRVKLSFMMFLEFFIWGAWFVTMGTYLTTTLHATGVQNAGAYATQALGAILAPFIIGTLALVNSVAFKQMKNPSKEFPLIRVLGTLGWIVAGIIIAWLDWEHKGSLVLTFRMAAIVSLVLGLFSFTLPDTPPGKKGQKVTFGEIIGLDAIGMLKKRSYLIFFIASVAICIPLAFYYNFTNPFLNEIGMVKAAGKQAWGQVSELVFMALMPLFFVRLGVKKMLAFGMLAWAIRYLFFAYGDTGNNYWMLIGGIVLHGICYDFFFVTGQIYTDNFAGERFKSSAQGFITLATYGVGMLIGYYLSGPIVDHWKTSATSHNWQSIWLIPGGIAAVVLIVFLLFFTDKNQTETRPGLDIEEPSAQVEI